MPLKKVPKNASKKAQVKIISSNVKMLIDEGKSQKQAVAIALSQAKEDRKKK